MHPMKHQSPKRCRCKAPIKLPTQAAIDRLSDEIGRSVVSVRLESDCLVCKGRKVTDARTNRPPAIAK